MYSSPGPRGLQQSPNKTSSDQRSWQGLADRSTCARLPHKDESGVADGFGVLVWGLEGLRFRV